MTPCRDADGTPFPWGHTDTTNAVGLVFQPGCHIIPEAIQVERGYFHTPTMHLKIAGFVLMLLGSSAVFK